MKEGKTAYVLLAIVVFLLPVMVFAEEPEPWRYSLSLHYGYANMVAGTAGLTNSSRSYEKDLCSGMSWDFQYYYRYGRKRIFGLGAIYSGFTSKGTLQYSTDHVYTHYIAPQLNLSLWPTSRFFMGGNTGFGYFMYRNNSTVFGKGRRVMGDMPAVNFGLNGTYCLSQRIGISLNMQYIFTELYKVHIDYHDEITKVKFPPEKAMQASRLNISGGINFFF